MILCALLWFIWDGVPEATHYTLYEQTGTSWVQRGQTTQTDLRVSVPKGIRTFAVTASNQNGESEKSVPVKIRVKK